MGNLKERKRQKERLKKKKNKTKTTESKGEREGGRKEGRAKFIETKSRIMDGCQSLKVVWGMQSCW